MKKMYSMILGIILIFSTITYADMEIPIDVPKPRPCIDCIPKPIPMPEPVPMLENIVETHGSSTQRIFTNLDADLTLNVVEMKNYYKITVKNIGFTQSEDTKLYVNFLYEKSIIYYINELNPFQSVNIYQEKERFKPATFSIDPYYKSHDLNYKNNQVIIY